MAATSITVRDWLSLLFLQSMFWIMMANNDHNVYIMAARNLFHPCKNGVRCAFADVIIILYGRRPTPVQFVTMQGKMSINRPVPGRFSNYPEIYKSLKSYAWGSKKRLIPID